MQIEPVIWDSDFFRLSVGKVDMHTFNLTDFEQQKKTFDLIYIFEEPASDLNDLILTASASLVDQKTTYTKELHSAISISPEISMYDATTPNEQLIQLTLQSGIYSRFKSDEHFPAHAYEKLYKEWIFQSCNKSMAFCVLVHGPAESPEGFITVATKDGNAQIGLIAVDEHARGKGIGKKLIEAAEYMAKNHNFNTLKVVTQGANKEACKLYEKCGFEIDNIMNIYHYWNK